MPDPVVTVGTIVVTLELANLALSVQNARELGHDQTARSAASDAEDLAEEARQRAREANRNLAEHERRRHDV